MKISMVAGAMIGFLIGILFGLITQSPWPSILWRSSLAALALGLLTRWWSRVWLRGLEQAMQQRLAAQEAQRKEAKPTAPSRQ